MSRYWVWFIQVVTGNTTPCANTASQSHANQSDDARDDSARLINDDTLAPCF